MHRKIWFVASLNSFLLFVGCENPLNVDRFAGTARLTSSTLSSPKAISGDLATTCPSGLAACLTPYSMSGQIYYAAAFVGASNPYRIGPIIGQMQDADEATEFASDSLFGFDVNEGTIMAGSPQCCDGDSPAYPSDAQALLQYLQFYFAYIDVGFILGSDDGVGKAIRGNHKIRVVFANITGTNFMQGDLLYKGPGGSKFKWCTSEGCESENRPENPLQDKAITNFRGVKPYNQILPEFRIVQHQRDKELLEKIRNFFGYGAVTLNHGNVMELRIRGLENLNRLVSFFKENPLKSKKQSSFEIFAEIISMMNEKKHLSKSGVQQICNLAEKMNRQLKRNLESSETVRLTPAMVKIQSDPISDNGKPAEMTGSPLA